MKIKVELNNVYLLHFNNLLCFPLQIDEDSNTRTLADDALGNSTIAAFVVENRAYK